MLYTSLFVWEMSVIWEWLVMFEFLMWILMSSVEGWFLILLKWWNAWFYWEKIGICKEIFWIFYEDFLRKFCDFWSSSIEALFYKGLMGFLSGMRWFLVWLEVVKCLIFRRFVEVGIEVVFLGWIWVKCFGNADFIRSLWIEQICHSWQPVVCSKM